MPTLYTIQINFLSLINLVNCNYLDHFLVNVVKKKRTFFIYQKKVVDKYIRIYQLNEKLKKKKYDYDK